MTNVLLLGRKKEAFSGMIETLNSENHRFFIATSLDEVRLEFDKSTINIVIMGAGLELANRLRIVEFIYQNSKSTTVHMKDWETGPAGMLPFVKNILNL